MKNFIKIILLFIFLLFSKNARANDKDLLKSVENYLNNIKFFQAHFFQDNTEEGTLSEGNFYISRPGKLRVEYTNPSEILVITNNKVTTYYDVELDEITNIPTKSTPIHFLVRDNFSFSDKDLKIKDLIISNKIELSLTESGKEDKGSITLIFNKNPISLVGIKISNELSQTTEVYFSDIKLNENIKKSMFVFKNPRLYK